VPRSPRNVTYSLNVIVVDRATSSPLGPEGKPKLSAEWFREAARQKCRDLISP
jgi:hypothetical protein